MSPPDPYDTLPGDIEAAFEWEDPYEVILALCHVAADWYGDHAWESLPWGLRVAVLVDIFGSQLANGGFHQYLSNYGETAPEVHAMLYRIGARACARLLGEALELFPERTPRFQQIDALTPEQQDRLDRLTRTYYSQDEYVYEVAVAYLAPHRPGCFLFRGSQATQSDHDP